MLACLSDLGLFIHSSLLPKMLVSENVFPVKLHKYCELCLRAWITQQAAQCKYETKGKGKVMGIEMGSLFARKEGQAYININLWWSFRMNYKNLQKSVEMALESTKETVTYNLLV